MEKYYNNYFRTTDLYESKFCFVTVGEKLDETVVKRLMCYVNCIGDYRKHTGYYSCDESLFNPHLRRKIINNNKKLIEYVEPIIRYVSYIKILEDKNHPELNGEVMLFSFGRMIYDMIQNNPGYLHDEFHFIKRKTNQFDNFDRCYFSDNNKRFDQSNLSLSDKIVYPKFGILLTLERSLKLRKLKTIINENKKRVCE